MNVNALKTMQVVCVDDEQEALEQMHLALNSFCKTTVCVSSTEKALLAIDELRPDIVLTDVRMPGASGLDLLETVKKNILPLPSSSSRPIPNRNTCWTPSGSRLTATC